MSKSDSMADSIFFGGEIITVDDARPEAEAVAVKDGKILAVGTYKDVIKFRNDVTEMVDMSGKTILPGLIEPHCHPMMSAVMYNHFADVSGYTYSTRAEALDSLKKVVTETPKGDWILAYGFDPILMGDIVYAPTKKFIDNVVSEDHPVFILAQTAHTAFCNSKAFERAGVTKDTPQPRDGEFVKDEEGELNGVVNEIGALNYLFNASPAVTFEQHVKYVKKQLNNFAKAGFTTVAELGVGFGIRLPDPVGLFHKVGEQPNCPLRLIGYIPDNAMKKMIDMGELQVKTPEANNNVHIAGVKILADGSPYTGTMATREPYKDTHMTRDCLAQQKYPNYGALNFTYEKLIEMMRPFHQKGWQIATHTHGERAIHQVLDVYESLLHETPRKDHRYRLEHCGLITEQQLKRAKSLGVTVTFFINHIYFYGKALSDLIIGEDRTARWCPLNTATKAGHRWSLHCDTPCTPIGPFTAMRTAVTRLTRTEEKNDPKAQVMGIDERISVDEAIKAWTINPAWQMFHEHLLGSIEVGKIADFTVIDRNPKKIKPEDLDKIQVVATYKSGKLANGFQEL